MQATKLGHYWSNGSPHDGEQDTNVCGGQKFWGNGEPSHVLGDNVETSPSTPGTWRPDPAFLGTNLA